MSGVVFCVILELFDNFLALFLKCIERSLCTCKAEGEIGVESITYAVDAMVWNGLSPVRMSTGEHAYSIGLATIPIYSMRPQLPRPVTRRPINAKRI